jgi:hypothetical protein
MYNHKEFFKWVTDSIKTSSINTLKNATGFELAKLDGELSKIDLTKSEPTDIDDNFVVLNGKCQNTKALFNEIESISFAGIELATSYRLVGAYQVDNSYFELADNANFNNKVNTDD